MHPGTQPKRCFLTVHYPQTSDFNMLHHVHTVLCNRIIVDKRQRLASYIDLIEGIAVKRINDQIVVPRFMIASKWWNPEDVKVNQLLELKVFKRGHLDKTAKPIHSFQFKINRQQRAILLELDMSGISLEYYGAWSIIIKAKTNDENWRAISFTPLIISEKQ